jgi:hypothetical protein
MVLPLVCRFAALRRTQHHFCSFPGRNMLAKSNLEEMSNTLKNISFYTGSGTGNIKWKDK